MELALIDHQAWNKSSLPSAVWLTALGSCLGAGLAAVWWGWGWAFAPLVVAAALLCVFQPVWGLYLLVAALFFPYEIIPDTHAYPADGILFLIVIGFWLRRAKEGKSGLVRTPLDVPLALWLGILALSLVNAYDVPRGVINWLRHVQLLLLFYAVAGIADTKLSARLLRVFIVITIALAGVNVVRFVQSGGAERVYGIARLSFNSLLTIAIVYLAARFCFEPRPWPALGYGTFLVLTALGQIANQSRAAIGASGIGAILVLILAWTWGNKRFGPLPRARATQIMTAGLLSVALGVLFSHSLLQITFERFEGALGAATTLHYRYFLWKTAVASFLQYPVLGIGLGQVQVWEYILPTIRLDPIGRLTYGLGTHLEFLKYLAETGIIGTTAFLWVLVKATRLAIQFIRQCRTPALAGHLLGISTVVLIIILRAFLEGHMFYAISGMTTALFFGFLAAHWREQVHERV